MFTTQGPVGPGVEEVPRWPTPADAAQASAVDALQTSPVDALQTSPVDTLQTSPAGAGLDLDMGDCILSL